MNFSEAEAKKKFCPAAGMRDRCVGTACMGWHWNDSQQNSYGKTKPEGEDWEKVGNFWTRTPKEGCSYRVGFCAFLDR